MTAPTLPTRAPNDPDVLREKIVINPDCRYGRMIYLSNDAYVGRSFDQYGEFSEGEVDIFRQILKPGMLAIDAGANIGAHTVPMAQFVSPGGAIFAFEPFRFLAQMCSANVILNGLTNVRVSNYALGAEHGVLKVPPVDFTLDDNYGGSALGQWEYGENVPMMTIDEMTLPILHFIKADVEGMERDVLLGGVETISEHKPYLYVENNKGDDPDRSRLLISTIRELGYIPFWHYPALYNPKNWRNNAHDVFAQTSAAGETVTIISSNMICIPEEHAAGFDGEEATE